MALRVVAIIQARLGSTRLPGKVLMPLCGKPMLQHIYDRVSRATRVDDVFIAAPYADYKQMDSTIVAEPFTFIWDDSSDENDLVARYLAAADMTNADIIVRICADNPCVQPEYIDAAVEEYLAHPHIFYTNTIVGTHTIMGDVGYGVLVDGLGCEVLSLSRLKWLDEKTRGHAEYREHPHKYFFHNASNDSPDLRLDVNTQADFDFITDIYEHCYPTNPQFGIEDIVAYLGPERIRACRKPPAPK